MNIPNLITMCRFVMIPFFFWSYTANNFLVAAILFFAAGVSDMLDGMIARKFNLTSDLNEFVRYALFGLIFVGRACGK